MATSPRTQGIILGEALRPPDRTDSPVPVRTPLLQSAGVGGLPRPPSTVDSTFLGWVPWVSPVGGLRHARGSTSGKAWSPCPGDQRQAQVGAGCFQTSQEPPGTEVWEAGPLSAASSLPGASPKRWLPSYLEKEWEGGMSQISDNAHSPAFQPPHPCNYSHLP